MPHYYDEEPATPSAPVRVRLALPDATFDLETDRGVFSRGEIDAGTKLLLLEAPAPAATGDLLDLGCGYGPVALTMARRAPGATVWAIDVNRRALALTAANAEAAGLANVRVALPEEVPGDVRFSTVWSNPPIRIGKAELHSMLTTWLGRLAPGGTAVLVVQKHLGADSLTRWLNEAGWPTRRLVSRASFRLLEASGPT